VRVLVLNAGSSSLKASVIDDRETLLRTSVSWGADATRAADRSSGVRSVLEALGREQVDTGSIAAVGHRVVHGGARFAAPVAVDGAVLASLDALGELAPLHNAVAVETIRAALDALPGILQVACFDTAFHATLPEPAARYPVPAAWHDDWGIRRFGFHGLSVAWAVERAGPLLGGRTDELGLVVAHLGSGCSVTAVESGRSVSTSMGFTPLEGLMMGTRAGSLDPGILLHLLRTERIDVEELADALEHRSGLAGVSGRSADLRELEPLADAGDERASLALEMFATRAAAGIAAAAVALRRLDAVVFTGGIGEHAGRVRAAIVGRLGVLGLRPVATDETGQDRVLALRDHEIPGASAGPAPIVLRIEAREDLVIARAVAEHVRTA
jgi:acetate kinase